jgi:hypothetical protein
VQDRALDLEQQLVAPVECGPERLVPAQCGAVATGEQPETIVQRGGEFARSITE